MIRPFEPTPEEKLRMLTDSIDLTCDRMEEKGWNLSGSEVSKRIYKDYGLRLAEFGWARSKARPDDSLLTFR